MSPRPTPWEAMFIVLILMFFATVFASKLIDDIREPLPPAVSTSEGSR